VTHPVRVLEKKLGRLALLLVGASIVLALVSRSMSFAFSTPIPVANFYDRVSGSSANSIYFLGMYLLVVAILPALVSSLRQHVLPKLTFEKRLLCSLFLLAPVAFTAYLVILLPADTSIGTGRFSSLLAACAEWTFAHGLINGVFFWCGSFFLGLLVAGLLGARDPHKVTPN